MQGKTEQVSGLVSETGAIRPIRGKAEDASAMDRAITELKEERI
jgi:hypothetical protein